MTDPHVQSILVAGIYWSGSGAVVDYLKGHPDCAVPRGEFTDFKRQGRIGSMLEAGSLGRARWLARAMWLETALGKRLLASLRRDKRGDQAARPVKEQVAHQRLKLRYLKEYQRHLSAGGPASDTSIWQRWLQEVVRAQCGGKAAVVWNQPIWVGKHEHYWPAVFAPYKLVVVHRDPADQFAEVVRQGKLGKRKSDPAFDDRIKDDVSYVLSGIAAKMQHLLDLKAMLPSDRLLCVNFEDFVIHHQDQAARLSHFLNLPLAQVPGAPFDPAVSKNNIGIGKTPEIQAMLSGYQQPLARLYQLREQL